MSDREIQRPLWLHELLLPEPDLEPPGDTIEYIAWRQAVLDQENADVQ